MPHAVPRSAAAAIAASLILIKSPVHAQDEGRALWVVRTTLASPSATATMVASAKGGGFNTLLVQICGRADAYFQHGLEPPSTSLAAQHAFDPLATTIARAHEAALQVHAWINVDLVAGANELPAARQYVVYRHLWLMVPRALAEDLASIDRRSPGYLVRLARYVRGQSTELEGLYLSPMSASAADHCLSSDQIVENLRAARRLGVGGVILFSHDSLTDPARGPGYLSQVGRAAFNASSQ